MGFHVLLVEPDTALADEIRRAFGPAGFAVTTLSAGESAVDRCRQEPPDLILLAAELPDMSGFSVCNRLKRALASVPLLLYSAEATEAAVEAHRATRTRADDYLRKPFEIADLLGHAAALLHAQPPAAAPAEPPAAPRPDGGRAPPPLDLEDLPPVLQRVDSGAVASRGLASALAGIAEAPPRPPAKPRARPPGPPPPPAAAGGAAGPPPVPGQRAPAALGRMKLAAAREDAAKDPFEVLGDLPRDPAPPKGTPEEKLEYFRERLRARDTFLARVREAVAEMRAAIAQASGERDLLQATLETERAQALALEQRLQEAGQDAAAQAARLEDLKKQLEASETTRQSLSDVLSETMQGQEAAEQASAARVAAADGDRARLEAELAEQAESHARAVAALEAERAEERARGEAARAEAEASHARALDEVTAERERERAEAAEKLAAAE
jgi:CheY-like chemotaxis protein